MEERKFVKYKKDELGVKEFIKKSLGKGKISNVELKYTPVGDRIILTTNKPGIIIGKRGERLRDLTEILTKRFSLDNPHIDIQEIKHPEFDAQVIADDIALSLERLGSLKFKVIAYRTMERIIKSGALGIEIRLSGKLPSERAKSWRFAYGYLKKTGDTAKIVDKGNAVAKTIAGVIGVKVSILPPDRKIHDQIEVNENLFKDLKSRIIVESKDLKTEEKK